MVTFLQTLIRPDREESAQRAEVAKAANLLQVGEFQFLQLAYREWHGEDLPEAMTGPLFRQYMLRDGVPAWARHYARRILALDRSGLLDDRDPRFHRFDSDYGATAPRGFRRFALAASTVAAVLLSGVVIGDFAANNGQSILPPYFDANDLDPDRGRPAS